MVDLLNQAIYERDINKLEGLLLEGVDPNDLSGSESPLKIVIEHGKPEELELLLDYGADPNIDNGSGITVFTDIIFLILSSIIGRHPDEEPADSRSSAVQAGFDIGVFLARPGFVRFEPVDSVLRFLRGILECRADSLRHPEIFLLAGRVVAVQVEQPDSRGSAVKVVGADIRAVVLGPLE